MNYASKKEQMKIYFGKCRRSYVYDKGWIALIGAIVIPLLAVMVVGRSAFSDTEDTRILSFILICACIWIGIFNSIQSICKERDIIKHEYREGMNLGAYIGAHMLFEMIQSLLETILVSAIFFVFYSGNIMNAGGNILDFIGYFLTFFFIIYTSDVLGILISSIVKKAETAMCVMPFILVVQLIFAGFISLNNAILQIVSLFTVSKWGYDAMLNLAGIPEKTGSSIGLEIYDKTVPALFAWIILCLFIFLFAKMACKVLKNVDHDER